MRNSRNVWKLSACANGGCQAFFPDYSNGPGYEAKNNYVSNSDAERMRKS